MDFLREQGVELGVGVLSTFVAAAIGWWSANFLLPAVVRIFSDDVDIAGAWSASQAAPEVNYHYHLDLRSRFRRWSGSAVISRSSQAAGDYRHTFRVAASKRGDYVMINLLGSKESRGSLATGLLLLEQRGNAMRGSWVYRPSSAEVPECEGILFTRTGA